jgi:hypothetical protein
MKVLVCGGRKYKDRAFVFRTLTKFHEQNPITLLIHGAAEGADSFANHWAELKGVKISPHPIKDEDWTKFHYGAGPQRNKRMYEITKPDVVIAFPGKNGTANMVAYAKKKGCLVVEYK